MNNRQPSQQPIYCHHPHPHSHAAAAAAAAAHAHYHQHQQHYPYVPASAQQIQQQQQQQQQNQIYQQIPAQLGPMPVTSGNPHSIYQSTSGPAPIYVSNSATMRRQSSHGSNGPHSLYGQHPSQHQQSHQQQLPPHLHQQQQHPGPHTAKSPPNETIEVPSSNSIDSAMYERDKQIYKCSTLRQGGKFDPKYKPSILNCPLPEIPKDAGESPKREESSNNYSKTLQRPPMKLPPHMKVISPPRIENPSQTQLHPQNGNGNGHINGQAMTPQNPSPPLTVTQQQQQQQQQIQQQQSQQGSTNNQTKSPPPPSAVSMSSSPPKLGNNQQMNANNSLPNGDDQDLPPPPPPALNDDSNYAVTEL